MRKELFKQLRFLLNELEITYQPKKYFEMSDNQLKALISKYSDDVDRLEENCDYRMYRGV